MRVFVTGGTGAIGSHAISALVTAGHDVTALARSESKAADLRAQGARPVQLSLFDPAALTTAFQGHDAVVNLASALPSPQRFMLKSAWAECQRIRTQGSAAVVDAALAAGVARVIQESVAMIYRDHGDRWIDEDSAVDHFPIAVGNHAAESNARRFGGSGRDAVVLRFGLFYGPGASNSDLIMDLARRHIGFQAGRADAYVSSIHLGDAARAVVAALGCDAGTYNIVDDQPVTKKQNVRAMAAAVNSAPWVTVPGQAALLLGDRSTSLTRSLRVSNQRFRTATNWRPEYPSVWEGYRALAQSR
ncbi:NAD(P)-dependent oxidoreductase [Mycolicibacterium smegmatis]|uniref:NAD-dependent epimerase/dehydratase family protein n=1 Tax=Mycolicibacterium smegmatis TaxID=1772 RepID=UPI0009BF4C25|nr:NAD(P)-dependent oxidoreductase [Mycolicibacterium smegmatis]MDF1908568.1 NAD(P)-dependent oxidoreductase [Mycolicibacterium smegmatis]MDF1916117.1 NAD(P)-dependent oxidoreductase [Mycolicibacterium smegmatis]MDF1923399.1 NAD(P)-dependent oxidoreductase [Mycolicibacterium smegmatis]UAK58779.1 NAD(P)-dependent oxidoreductase [Mycolicibacterium smegmatis]UGT78537.1 NAD(P)-dependent oxidoreductase [Mycolicibacterium smegmatis]